MQTSGALTITTPSDREVHITRAFDAAPGLVFDAFTKPELVRRWYGPTGWSLVVCDVDLRVGGAWRFVSHRPDGKTIGQHGIYREVIPGARLVYTESWDEWDAGETLVTMVLSAEGGKTLLQSTLLFPSKDVRDTVLKSGLEKGATETYDKLAQLVESAALSP